MCPLLRGVGVALVFVVAMIPSPCYGQAVVYSWPLCLQGQDPYTTGTWPCYLYYVSYPFLDQVHVDPADHVTQTEAEVQSQENGTSVETEPQNNTTDTAEQEITSVETEPEDNTTYPLEVVAELQHQLEDQARQLDLLKNQLHILTVSMGKALQLLLERHGVRFADPIQHAENHARPWESTNNQLQILAAAMGKALNMLHETQEENDARTGVVQQEVDQLQEQMQSLQQALLPMADTAEHHAAHSAEPSMTHFHHEHPEHVEHHAHPLEHHENQLQILIASMRKALHMLYEIQEETDAQTDLLQQDTDQQQEQVPGPKPETAANPTVNQEDQQLEEKVQQQAIQMQNLERELGELKFRQQQQDTRILILLQTMFEITEENERLEEQVEQQALQMQDQINQMKQQRDRLHYLDHGLHSLRESLNERRQVAFSVRFNRWTIVTVGGAAAGGSGYAADTLKFNETLTNIGDGYDPTTGLFTAPCAGLYAFFFSHHHVHSSGVNGRVTLGVFHGDQNIALSTAYGGQAVSCDRGSGFGTVHLTKGEVVHVRLVSTSSEEEEEDGRSLSYDVVEVGPFTTFSGMLVAPDRLSSLK